VPCPVAVYYGAGDYLADEQDVQTLISELGKQVVYQQLNAYAHMDFVWADNANSQIYNSVVQMLQKYSSASSLLKTTSSVLIN